MLNKCVQNFNVLVLLFLANFTFVHWAYSKRQNFSCAILLWNLSLIMTNNYNYSSSKIPTSVARGKVKNRLYFSNNFKYTFALFLSTQSCIPCQHPNQQSLCALYSNPSRFLSLMEQLQWINLALNLSLFYLTQFAGQKFKKQRVKLSSSNE